MTARVVPDGPAAREEAAEILASGGVVGLPTDTVYGIAVARGTSGGVERLFAIKQRPPDKAVVLLIDDLDQVADLVRATPAARALSGLWPGGLTLVLPEAAGDGTIAVRVPDHPAPRALARTVGPIPTTSANLSGEPEARTAAEVMAALGGSLALILDGGPSPGGIPSTVVDCTALPVRILRTGAIPAAAIDERLTAAGLERSAPAAVVGR
ncbi:MAG TPA: L-threonylcarbamoyladenylate synthase [Candidatus Limnocylindrales bacterium]|nr:L-threonylcarbamoyladenylate synthase [Candidatus Limnocylindrales bacterium]